MKAHIFPIDAVAPRSVVPDVSEPARTISVRRFVPKPRLAPVGVPVPVAEPVSLYAVPPPPPAPPPASTGPNDARMIAILDAPLADGETAFAGFARKEHELGTLFAQLAILEARELHQRLANPKPDDVLATKFSRLTVERKQRLLNFLADARRRAALAGC